MAWNRVPPPEERIKRHSIAIERDGRSWSGSYTVEHRTLFVESAYGSRTMMVGIAKDLKAKAEKALAAVVEDYSASRAAAD
jgi:hypothetical protein